MKRRITSAGLCLAGLSLVLGACSDRWGDERSASPPTTERPASEPTADAQAAPSTERRTFQLAAAASGAPSADVPDQPIASAPAQVPGSALDVYALERQGDRSLLLVFGYHNVSAPEPLSILFQLQDKQGPNADVRGVSLFDPRNLKRYLVYLDDADECLCSATNNAPQLEQGETAFFAALFPAPPPDVAAVTVVTPIGSVPDVAVAGG